MKPTLSSYARSGLIALGVLTGLSATAFAGPMTGPIDGIGQAAPSLPIQKVGSGEWDPNCGIGVECPVGESVPIRPRTWERVEPRVRADPPVRAAPRNWEGQRRNWNNYSDNDGWRYSRPYRYHDYYRRPSIYLDFSAPSYRYVEPSYRYVQPRYVQPRPYRRVQLSQAHVEWCYNRYRSYRAYDNTFQPYHGPRQQCYSPYS